MSGNLTEDDVNSLATFFEDDETNDITNYIDGSPVIALIGEYIEKETKSYSDFYSDMQSYQQYHVKGDDVRPVPAELIRKIYVKYIYKMHGTDDTTIDSLYDLDLENRSETELDEMLQKVDSDYKSGAIDSSEYYYLSDKIIEAWRKIIE